MNELKELQKRQNQIFVLVCINFLLFMILFLGLGYVTWQSAALVNRLKSDVDRAEQAIVELQGRLQNMDANEVVDRLVTNTTDRLGASIKDVVQNSDFAAPLAQSSEKLARTQEKMEATGEVIQAIGERVQGLDSEAIAQSVSYHILKGLADGFQEAAKSRKPESIKE